MTSTRFHCPAVRPLRGCADRPAPALVGLALCALVGCSAPRDDGEATNRVATVEERADAAKRKAETLEEKASSEGDGAAPSPREVITSAEAQAVDPKGKESLEDAITCLARSIYWETKGEDQASMEAVASVVMNRLGRPDFPDTVCGVVKQGRESGACQFSWWCDGRPDTVQETGRYGIAKEVARLALNRQLPDRTGGATYFHHKRVSPRWSKTYTRTAVIGVHRFYAPPGDGKSRPDMPDRNGRR